MRRVVRVLVAVVLTTIGVAVPASQAGAGSLSNATWWLFNDSPWYEFAAGAAPTRNAPLGVWTLQGAKTKRGLEFEITSIVAFAPVGTELSGRIGFYGAPARSPMLYGGVEFRLSPAPGESAPGTLVEREGAGTPTSPELWEEADEDFGDADITYTDVGVELTISATGSYRKLLRDPLTSVGFDVWQGTPGTNVQPSARVSIGDLTGAKPGLFPQQGTSIAADGSPQPWITQPVADDFFKWRVRGSAAAANPQHVTVGVGKYAMDAVEIRTFIASEFEPVAPGARFPAYQLALFEPGQTSARLRLGDAFLSADAQSFTIGRSGKSKFALEFSSQLFAGYANVQVVVPGQTDAVLLAIGLQYKF